MSINIWEAYKIPINRLNEFLGICRQRAKEEFGGFRFWALYRRWLKSEDDHERISQLRVQEDSEYSLAQLMFTTANLDKSHNYEMSLDIWIDGKFAYIIPYGFRNLAELPDWAEDFHYQNQTDRPEGITSQAYSERRKKWDKLCLKDGDATRLQHEILVFSRYHSGTLRILEELCAENKPWEDVNEI